MILHPEETLEEVKSNISEEKRLKLEEFRNLKDRLAILNRKEEKTQEKFNKYIKRLFNEDQCKYITGIKSIVSLCSNNLFDCKFRSRENFNFHGKLKFECLREKTIKLRKLF